MIGAPVITSGERKKPICASKSEVNTQEKAFDETDTTSRVPKGKTRSEKGEWRGPDSVRRTSTEDERN